MNNVLLDVWKTALGLNESMLKKTTPKYSLEGLILMLKLQYSSHLIWRADSLEKDLDAGKDWRQEEKGSAGDEIG